MITDEIIIDDRVITDEEILEEKEKSKELFRENVWKGLTYIEKGELVSYFIPGKGIVLEKSETLKIAISKIEQAGFPEISIKPIMMAMCGLECE